MRRGRSAFLDPKPMPMFARMVPARYRLSPALARLAADRAVRELRASTFRLVRRSTCARGHWTEREWIELKISGKWVRA